ncbi:MAG: OmpA family protein [Phycisphaeraceae bacterium]|nr:MAG: OmpA family protein [Phycisphaeraceae bacterium]
MTNRRNRIYALALVSLAGAGLSGCVSQQAYDELRQTNVSLENRNAELARRASELEATNRMLTNERQSLDAALAALRAANGDLAALTKQQQDELNRFGSRLQGLSGIALDPTTDAALQALVAQYPNLMSYDPALGMIRFNADLTFDSGSDVVKDSARQALDAFARVLNSSSALNYEAEILGHTDSQRISASTASRHPTNMHLSAHRAISVRAVLGSMGVPADRLKVSGWGEFRPAVPNAANGNTPANRRVEIYLRNSTAGISSSASPSGGSASPDRDPVPTRQLDPTK